VVEGDEGARILSLCRDASIRKQVTEERKRAHRELQTIIDTIPDLFYVVGLDEKLIAWNDAVLKTTGKTTEQLGELSMRDLVHPDDQQTAIEAFERAIATGLTSVEVKVLTANGDYVPHSFTGSPRRDEDGNITGLFGTARDVSEWKRAEEALRASEEKYRGIFNDSVAAIYVFDEAKNFVDSNQAGLDLLGYSRDELLSMSIPDVDANTEVVQPAHGQLLGGDKIVNFEHELIHKDGSTIVVLNNSRPLFDTDGKVTGMQSTLVDITERKRAEEVLRRSDQNLRNLFSTVEDLFFILDMTGNILEVNDHVLEKLGYDHEDLVGKSVLSVHPPDRAEEAMTTVADMIAGKVDVCLIPLVTKDGREITVETIATQGVWEDQDVLFGISRDITERKRLEERLLRTRKLESLGVLAGGIAHDFNNLLTAILGGLSVARMQAEPGGELHETLVSTEKASELAKRLTRQLLTFSKGGTPIRKTVAIDELLRESATFVLSGSNVECGFAIEEGLWPVKIDEGLMSQVISNIVINADQAMPDGGAITVEALNVERTEGADTPIDAQHFIHITIRDEGMGIDEKVLGRIFDPYFTTKEEGSGLGLATSHSIIEGHEGRIHVTTSEGSGSTFHIYLPAYPGQSPERKPAQRTPASGSGRILVMDDEEIVQQVVEAMLDSLGYESALVGSGEAAIDLYRENLERGQPFDAVIIDLTIRGGMGGREAIEHLRKIDPGIKAIVSSGYSTDPIMANYAEYGFSGVVTKPYSLDHLSDALNDLLHAEAMDGR